MCVYAGLIWKFAVRFSARSFIVSWEEGLYLLLLDSLYFHSSFLSAKQRDKDAERQAGVEILDKKDTQPFQTKIVYDKD